LPFISVEPPDKKCLNLQPGSLPKRLNSSDQMLTAHSRFQTIQLPKKNRQRESQSTHATAKVTD